MAIETPVESVEGEFLKLIPLDLQSRLAILGWPTGTIYEGESQ